MRSSSLQVFHAVGVSHRTAPVSVREQLALTPAQAAAWLDQQQRADGRSVAILSTCNRFEVYWTGSHDLEPWFHGLARARGIEPGTAVTRWDGGACVRHLYQVAAGLDSQIVGESEILGQVRQAHQTALEAGTSSRELDAMFSGAVTAGRRVRRETRLGKHPASVSSAAVEVALATIPQDGSATAIILGAGEVAAGVVRALLERGVRRVIVVNRRPERAAVLAAEWEVQSRLWTDLSLLLPIADVVFVTTGAKHPLLRAEDLAAATARRWSELVVLDLAVPRNVEPAARRLTRVRLSDLDDLQKLCCPAAGEPSIAVAEGLRIIEDELTRLDASLRARVAAPELAQLHQLGEQLAREEAERALAGLERLSDVERQVVRDMAARLVRRVLYPVSRRLREEGPSGQMDGARWTA
jgi:glutamyl-tRNA reductase